MKKQKRLNIGVMIHYLDNDYSKILLRGVISAAEEMDVNLVIMPGRSLNCQLNDLKHTTYEYQYNSIYSYATAQNLDALIVSAGTVGQFVSPDEFKKFLGGFKKIPVITLESVVSGYPCIRLSSSGIKDIVNHLVTVHNRKNIAFVSGPKGNTDAEERLNYYRQALEENGMEFNPELVAYGRFSEYCVDLVGELLDRNERKIDAICFANDMMCKGGYTAIEQRGLVIGKDISVTGYDDSEIASALTPQLSTIRADASVLGYRALEEAVKLAKGEETETFINLESTCIKRQSCGCDALWNNYSAEHAEGIRNSSPEKLATLIIKEYISGDDSSWDETVKELKAVIVKFFEYTINMGETDPSDQRGIFDAILSNGLIKALSPGTFIDLLRAVRYISVVLCNDNHEKILAVHNVIEQGFDAVADYLLYCNANDKNDLTFTHFLINNISKDMLVAGADEKQRYLSIVENLSRMHMKCSYIYTFEEPVLSHSSADWKRPQYMYLRSYHDDEKVENVPFNEQKVRTSSFLRNKMSDRRRTLVLFPLFTNEENYGIIATEMEFDYFPYIYSIAPQICTAIKLTDLIKQLENSLDAATSRNNQLNRISMHDELTGVFNRRGFYQSANSIFAAPENDGRKCVLIFADLDNLKQINDNFGHEEGDFAIKAAASFLKNGLRNTDVVARIGGDEFTAFALCEDEKIIKSIPGRIKKIAEKYNQSSDKEYNITISIGIYELSCNPSGNIQNYMDEADSSLYEDKKNKNRDIFKKK